MIYTPCSAVACCCAAQLRVAGCVLRTSRNFWKLTKKLRNFIAWDIKILHLFCFILSCSAMRELSSKVISNFTKSVKFKADFLYRQATRGVCECPSRFFIFTYPHTSNCSDLTLPSWSLPTATGFILIYMEQQWGLERNNHAQFRRNWKCSAW